MINPLILMKAKQELDKFQKGDSSEIKVYLLKDENGFKRFELCLSDSFCKELKLDEMLKNVQLQTKG